MNQDREKIREVLLNEGINPEYHRKQIERLKKEWPLLYKVLSEIIEKSEYKKHIEFYEKAYKEGYSDGIAKINELNKK